MDVLAHSLWAIAVLPGEKIAAKIIFGVIPDLAVFGPNLLIMLLKHKKLPKFEDRQQMMDWFDKKDNRWVKDLYRWTHSLIIWAVMIVAAFIYCRNTGISPPWFLLGAPLHIILDIPTHTKNSFPVQFLTPISKLQINGIHWTKKWVLLLNYLLIILILLFRYVILK
jgi:hypothetical protein